MQGLLGRSDSASHNIHLIHLIMPSDNKKPAEEILDPQVSNITYGGKEYTVKPMGIKSILRLSRILGGRFGKMYDIFLLRMSIGEKVEKMIDSLNENEILDIISLALNISKEEAEKGFRALDMIRVLRIVFEQEDVGKIFFEIVLLKKAVEPKV